MTRANSMGRSSKVIEIEYEINEWEILMVKIQEAMLHTKTLA